MPLLAYILLHRDTPIAREKLGFVLWPDAGEIQGRANVRRHIYHVQHFLREIGEPFCLKTTGNTVRWESSPHTRFDVADFEKLSADPETFSDAVRLYTGDLLADCYDDWIFPERERLRSRYVKILEELVSRERSLRNFPLALDYVQLLLAHDPWREAAVRQLMALRYALGDRSAALAEYESFAQRLREEIGATPMSETVAIRDAILRNASLGIDEDASETLAASGNLDAALPFTGRESAIEILRRHWDRAARGHGNLVFISGEPGIGKTRCARELAILAEAQGARVLIGTTSFHEARPYQPIVEALHLALPLAAAIEIDSVWLSALSILMPEVREHDAAVGTPAPLDVNKEQPRLFESITQVLSALAGSRPVLLILEDVHWAGAATIAALEFIARRAPRISLMIVATYREDEVRRTHRLRGFRRRLEREGLTVQLPLARLPIDAVAEVAKKCGLDTEDVALRFFDQSEGNPFFLTEAIREYQGAPGQNEPLHGRTQELIENRIRGLTPPAVALAESAAIIGTSFDLELLRELSGWSEGEVFNGLDELVGRFIVREASQPHVDYSFSHHLFQHALYERTVPERRRRLHHRVARALLELYPDRIDDFAAQIANHLENAGEREEAAAFYYIAAQQARRYFANEEALNLVERALDCAPAELRFDALAMCEELCALLGDRAKQADVLDQLQALLPLGPDSVHEVLGRRIAYFHATGDRVAEQRAIGELNEQGEKSGDRGRIARVRLFEAQYFEAIGDLGHATALAEEVLSLSVSDFAGTPLAMCLLAELYSTLGRYAQSQALILRVLELADIQENIGVRIRALRAATRSAIEQRDLEHAAACATDLLLLCRRSGDREGEADALGRLAAVNARRGDVKSADEQYLAASVLYGSLNKPQGQAAIFTNRGLLFFLVGQCTKALDSYAKAQALFELIDDLRGKTVCALNSSQCHLYLKRFEDSERAAKAALEFARSLTSPSLEATALANVGAASRELKDYARAIEVMEAGIQIRRGLDESTDLASDLCDLGLTYLASGDTKSAAGVFTELQRFERKNWVGMLFPQYFPWVCANLSRAAGDRDATLNFVTEAHKEFKSRAAQIDHAAYRQSYRRLPLNIEISAAFKNLDAFWTGTR